MFARAARALTFERRHAVPPPVGQAFSGIHETDDSSATLRRRRPILLCRWQLDPATGRPVGAWEVESPGLADVGVEPNRSRLEEPLVCIAISGQQAVAGAFPPTRGT
jgi:hypothetical protein